MLPEKETASGHTQPLDSQSRKGRTEGHIHNSYDKDQPLDSQPLTPLDSVLRLLDCLHDSRDDHDEKRAQVRLIMDYIQSFIDDRAYQPPSAEDLDNFPF